MSFFKIDGLSEYPAGGKAAGLSLLKKWGFPIPNTYVLPRFDQKEMDELIATINLKKKYAVRSSASTEDGVAFSFAGQYETRLDVHGKKALTAAIESCFQSVNNQKAQGYQSHIKTIEKATMHVVVQEMVHSELSGVLFTVDPVESRYDKMSISFVSGKGERLMSGLESGKTVVFFKAGTQLPICDGIPSNTLQLLVNQAKEIERNFGKPADLEWALDENGKLFWLQLRPITGLKQVGMNEMDHQPLLPHPIYTRGNIGEMMPGPVTPLTLSTFARAIDYGLQVFYKKCGALQSISKENIFVHSFYNHLFFEVNNLYLIAEHALLATKENIDFSVVGQPVENVVLQRKSGFFKALWNFIQMVHYISGAGKAAKRLEFLYETFRLKCPDNAADCYRLIEKNLQQLLDAYSLHYVTSSQSGSYYSAILNLFSKGKTVTPEHQEKASAYFTDIPKIESAQVVKSIDQMAEEIARDPMVRTSFLGNNVQVANEYLTNKAEKSVRSAWKAFLKRHGHRCVREAEMREKEWAIDPAPVIESIQSKTQLLLSGKITHLNGYKVSLKPQPPSSLGLVQTILFRWLLPKARRAVARREQTKAWSVGVQYQFKKAYRQLGSLLVKEKWLSDSDLIYFLTHQEIGNLLADKEREKWQTLATERRALYGEMQQLQFADLTYGRPIPQIVSPENGRKHNTDMKGIPVSRGVVEGKVRVVKSMQDARRLKQGEIMVARFTDIGWSPFYSIIGGLITEIGSPLSHGAVVAREYGIPAVVGMNGAVSNLQTGELILLDAHKGSVRRINEKRSN